MLLRCPEEGGALTGWNGVSAEGALRCDICDRMYPVRDSIPCLLPDGLRLDAGVSDADPTEIAEKQNEMAARDAQADHYDTLWGLKLLDRIELPLSLRFLAPDASSIVLEGGCGTGRMTPLFAQRCRAMIAMDFSSDSIRAARRKLPDALRDRVLFIQADLSRLPLATGAFDCVGSFGVYQHLPTEKARVGALSEMARVVKSAKDGGRFAYSAYQWNGMVKLFAPREGHHPGGIYYRRYTLAEFKAQVTPYFRVLGHSSAMLYYYILRGVKLD